MFASQHLLEDASVKEWSFQKYPDSIIWVVKENGQLCGITYNKEQQVIGWHRHDTDGEYESVASIQTSEGNYDTYFIVKRGDKRFIERLAQRNFTRIEDAYFVDCGLSYNGTPETVFSGLDHLEGKTVVALADGSVVTGLVVSGGSVTLPNPASVVHIGLPYVCDLGTLGIEMQTQTGTIQDKLRRIPSIVLRLVNSRAAWVGTDESNLIEEPFRSDEDYGAPTRLYTGDHIVPVSPGNPREGRVFVRVSEPLPITVQAIISRVVYGQS